MNLSILQNFKESDFYMDPYPHIHIDQVLPWEVYNKLADEYPEKILKGNTTQFSDFRYYQHEFSEEYVTPLWKEFVDYHSSKEFKDKLIEIFKPGIKKYYPGLYEKYSVSQVCQRHEVVPGALKLEVQFVMNAIDAKSIRTPHLDAGRELFASLFYMKKPEDNSNGGDLIVYKKKGDAVRFGGSRQAIVDDIEIAKVVPYKANSLICFLNSVDSIHGVSERKNAECIRRYVNVDGHVKEKLFKLDQV